MRQQHRAVDAWRPVFRRELLEALANHRLHVRQKCRAEPPAGDAVLRQPAFDDRGQVFGEAQEAD